MIEYFGQFCGVAFCAVAIALIAFSMLRFLKTIECLGMDIQQNFQAFVEFRDAITRRVGLLEKGLDDYLKDLQKNLGELSADIDNLEERISAHNAEDSKMFVGFVNRLNKVEQDISQHQFSKIISNLKTAELPANNAKHKPIRKVKPESMAKVGRHAGK